MRVDLDNKYLLQYRHLYSGKQYGRRIGYGDMYFFGHSECPETIKPKLCEVLIDQITSHDVDIFYVGNQGRFGAIVRCGLCERKKEYPQSNYTVVLAYMPGKRI